MEIINIVMKENFLTKKPATNAINSTLIMVFLLLLGSYLYLNGFFHADEWMAASGERVFHKKEYWRAWSTLFAHGDLGHIASNLVLFIPFAYFLSGYFGVFFFPFIGFFIGGLINLIVLKTMPQEVWLIGVSGVVYWMGAAWITLSYLIDRRETRGKDLVKVIGISIILFVPDSFKVEVSYLSHFLGYFFGVLTGIIYYVLRRKKFRAADVYREIIEEDFSQDDLPRILYPEYPEYSEVPAFQELKDHQA